MTRSGIPRAFSLLVAGQGWVSTSPSGIASSGCLSRHSRTTSGRNGMRVPRMKDNPRGLQGDLVGLGDHAGIGDHGDIGELVGGLERVDHRQHGGGLGFVALERRNGQREPGRIGEQPEGDLRFQAAFLGEPGSRNPSPASVSKYSVETSNNTSDAGPSPAWAAHAAASDWRHAVGRRPAGGA